MAGITPEYICGFTDGEGSFNFACYNDINKRWKNWRFSFCVTNKDLQILKRFQDFFGEGKIYYNKPRKRQNKFCESWEFQIRNEKGLLRIISFFSQNPLLVKNKDFQIWKKGVFLKLAIKYHFRNSKTAEEAYLKIREELNSNPNRRTN